MNNIGNTCSNCGSIVEASQQFCTKCGSRVNVNYASPNQYTVLVQNKSSSHGKNVILYVIIVALLVITVTMFAAYSMLYINKNKDDEIKSEPGWVEQSQEDYSADNSVADNDYIFPSDRQIISIQQLKHMTKDEIALIRNEIYARHGYIFHSEEYRDYFSSKSWYVPNSNFDESMFNDYERINKTTIIEYEKSMGWR